MKKKELKAKKPAKKPVKQKQKQKQSQNVKINLTTSGPSGFQGPSNNTLYIPAPVHQAPINIHIPNQFNNKEGENLPIKNLVGTITQHNQEKEMEREAHSIPIQEREIEQPPTQQHNQEIQTQVGGNNQPINQVENNNQTTRKMTDEQKAFNLAERNKNIDTQYEIYVRLTGLKNEIAKNRKQFKSLNQINKEIERLQ